VSWQCGTCCTVALECPPGIHSYCFREKLVPFHPIKQVVPMLVPLQLGYPTTLSRPQGSLTRAAAGTRAVYTPHTFSPPPRDTSLATHAATWQFLTFPKRLVKVHHPPHMLLPQVLCLMHRGVLDGPVVYAKSNPICAGEVGLQVFGDHTPSHPMPCLSFFSFILLCSTPALRDLVCAQFGQEFDEGDGIAALRLWHSRQQLLQNLCIASLLT